MAVIAGLWNPEPHYRGTRHNVGAEVVDVLAHRWGVTIGRGPLRVRARIAVARRDDTQVVLALPNTNMNVSGPAVQGLLRYYKEAPGDLVVIHDDMDLEFGRLRVAFARGHGGHNGIRSIQQSLATREFWRLKIGLGRPPGRMDPTAYVLQRFSPKQREAVDVMLEDAADVVELWLTDPEAARERAAHRF